MGFSLHLRNEYRWNNHPEVRSCGIGIERRLITDLESTVAPSKIKRHLDFQMHQHSAKACPTIRLPCFGLLFNQLATEWMNGSLEAVGLAPIGEPNQITLA